MPKRSDIRAHALNVAIAGNATDWLTAIRKPVCGWTAETVEKLRSLFLYNGGELQLTGNAMKRAAFYVRVSTDKQSESVENQGHIPRQMAECRGWTIAEAYTDEGVSGAKGRDKRASLDAMLNDASRRKFDVVMAWAIDRVGRSLIDLLGIIQHLEACGVDLYHDQQNIDTNTPMGKLLFHVTGAFAEFERSMIRQRVQVGLNSIKARIAKDGKFETKAGIVHRRLGRPGAEPEQLAETRRLPTEGKGIIWTAKQTKLGTGTVHNLKREMVAA